MQLILGCWFYILGSWWTQLLILEISFFKIHSWSLGRVQVGARDSAPSAPSALLGKHVAPAPRTSGSALSLAPWNTVSLEETPELGVAESSMSPTVAPLPVPRSCRPAPSATADVAALACSEWRSWPLCWTGICRGAKWWCYSPWAVHFNAGLLGGGDSSCANHLEEEWGGSAGQSPLPCAGQ